MQNKTEKVYYENAGKGDHRRPREVDKETYEANWDRIFGKKEESQEVKSDKD